MRPALLALALALAGCDTTLDLGVPAAGDYPVLAVDAVILAEPGRYNVIGTVRFVETCDPSKLALCAAEGSIRLGDGPEPTHDGYQPKALVLVRVPEAWRVGDRGTFSVETTARDGGRTTAFTLVGYSP